MQLSFNIFKKCKISFSPNGSPNMQRHRCRKDKESISFLGRFHPREQLRCSVCKISGNVGSQSTSRSRLRIGGSLVPWVCTAQCPVCSFVHTKSATGTLHTFAQFRLASLANSSHGFGVWDPRPPAPSADEPSMQKKWRSLSDRLIANYGRTLHTTLMFSKNQCLRPGITCYAD